MTNRDLTLVARRYYAAFVEGDRAFFESALSPEFTFTSPYDDHIDRTAFFERCWPNHDKQRAIHVDSVAQDGDEVLVRYTCEMVSGEKFANMERMSFDAGGRLAWVEVYFGDPPREKGTS
jgi:ketosteroid isomerase-like protein